MPVWLQTVFKYIGKGLAAIFAGVSAAIGSTITALVQIGEGAAFSDVELVAWLTIIGTGLAAFGAVFGITTRQNSS